MKRSPALATLLALALPGAGLAYAGRWGAAIADAVWEAALYVGTVAAILSAPCPADRALPALVGSGAILVTKLATVITSARLAESNERKETRRAAWVAVAAAGSFVTAAALSFPVAARGGWDDFLGEPLERARIDRALVPQVPGWRVELEPSAWSSGAQHDQLAEWTGPSGPPVSVFAFPLPAWESFQQHADTVREEEGRKALEHLGGALAFTSRHPSPVAPGEWRVAYHVHDRVGHDVHLLVADVPAAEVEPWLAHARSVIATARWSPLPRRLSE